MEQSFGEDSVPPSGFVDKSRVLNVKPLRTLAPVFPSAPNSASTPQAGAPFTCVSPAGPFPPGVTPFYPFYSHGNKDKEQDLQTKGTHTQNSTHPISAAVPISSFRTPSPRPAGVANGGTGRLSRARSRAQSESEEGFVEEDGFSDSQNQNSFGMHMAGGEGSGKVARQKANKVQKRTTIFADASFVSPDASTDSMINEILSPSNLAAIASLRQAEGDQDTVGSILMIFNLVRRKINQIEETKEHVSGAARRPDLKAGTILMTKGIRTNINKRIGPVPGVVVGDIFFFRFELCLVGLHAPSMAGIDYMSLKSADAEDSMAVSIVSSGGYEDDVEDGEVLIYSGQGGVNYRDREASDQKLERGNLALSQSARRGNEVRVLRGLKDFGHPTGKVYVYDGLYTVQEHWVDKGKSGCSVFKYKLVRCSGQPAAYMTWKLIQQWRDGIIPRRGVILLDLTSGEEKMAVCLVNEVDEEKGPAYFTYSPTLKYLRPIASVEPNVRCNCSGGCLPSNLNCHCIQKNGGYLPFIGNGVLVSQKSLLYECGSHCSCPPNCRNRVSQGGVKVKLEVFKTKDKGWGLRSWDPIRAGAFICEYAGEVVDSSRVHDNDDYIFDATRTSQQQEVLPCDFGEAPKLPFPLIISAKNSGNVARFMNHSCSPNVSWQPLLRANAQASDLHIAFHASKHIPPLTELTYDYGIVRPDKEYQRKKKCLCGSKMCKGYFY